MNNPELIIEAKYLEAAKKICDELDEARRSGEPVAEAWIIAKALKLAVEKGIVTRIN